MKTNWKEIAIKIGSIQSTNDTLEKGGMEFAKRALEEILGDEWIEDAVEHAISGDPGSEIAMNCLRYIESIRAAKYAYKVYKESSIYDERSMAVWLIMHLRVKESFDWIEEFLNDESVIDWGIGLLDQLLWCEIIDNEQEQERIDSLFELADKNSEGRLKDNIDFIKDYLKQRKE